MELDPEKHVAHEVRTPSGESSSSPIEGKRDAKGILLEPQPSDDPQDPLNWPIFKKLTITAVLSLASFAGIAQSGANVSGIVVQSFTYHVGVGDMVNTVGSATDNEFYIALLTIVALRQSCGHMLGSYFRHGSRTLYRTRTGRLLGSNPVYGLQCVGCQHDTS